MSFRPRKNVEEKRRRARVTWAGYLAISGLIMIVAFLLVSATIFAETKRRFLASGPLPEERSFYLRPGTSLQEMSKILERQGFIEDETVFRIGTRFLRVERSLRAGEYAIPARSSMSEIVDILVNGQPIQHRFTVAEGLSVAEIISLLDDEKLVTGKVAEVPVEGSLAPDTYFFARGASKESLLNRMQESQNKILDELWLTREPGLPIENKQQALILASIVEKETGLASERRHIAGVFVNRLRLGMRLQSDPTVVYGLTKGTKPLGHGLKRSELAARTPYNTYQIEGLPPTPICNPGRESIAAVMAPMPTKDLFFVADGSGGHVFSQTLKEHNKNVEKWRAFQKQQ